MRQVVLFMCIWTLIPFNIANVSECLSIGRYWCLTPIVQNAMPQHQQTWSLCVSFWVKGRGPTACIYSEISQKYLRSFLDVGSFTVPQKSHISKRLLSWRRTVTAVGTVPMRWVCSGDCVSHLLGMNPCWSCSILSVKRRLLPLTIMWCVSCR